MNLAIGPMPERAAPAPASPRVSERAILRLGIGLAATFLAAAIMSGLLPVSALHGWVATHLALAGAATVAIGTFMPHFGVTLAGTRPEPWWLRLAGVLALAVGMATVALGRPLAGAGVSAFGGLLVLAGIGLTAWTTFAPMRSGLARRHPIALLTYGVALGNLAIGASLAVLWLLGWQPVVGAWVALKPAHAWLNVFGFASLTIAGTLIYLYPTMLGSRIRPGPSMAFAVVGLVIGPPLAAAGYATSLELVALLGGCATLIGAAGLLAYGFDSWRRRGRWSSDLSWHAVSAYHILAAMAWFVVAGAWATGRILVAGTAVPGWTLGGLAVAVIGGWVVQVLVAAWTYLLPAVGPGAAESRARQRAALGRGATWRIVTWNAGLLLLATGFAGASSWLTVPGSIAFGASALAALGLLASAIRIGRGAV